MMKRTLAYFLLALTLLSCAKEEKNSYTLRGIAGNGKQTLYLFGTDSRYDNLKAIKSKENGEFSFSIETDTVVPLMLELPEGTLVPVYAEPGVDATLVKDKEMKNGWSIDGGEIQALHDSISRELDACKSNSALIKKLDEFIEAYPINEVNQEIIRRYLVDIKEPQAEKIRKTIASLGGIMQDKAFFAGVKGLVEHKRSNIASRSFPGFSYTTAEGKSISQEIFLKKYTLVTFWATWNENSRKAMHSLREIYENVDTAGFSILNIALDHDTVKWKECVTSDSIVGNNVCDTRGWNSNLADEFIIPELPFSVLVTPYQRVNEYGVNIKNATERIDSLVKRHQKREREKELKNRNRNS